MIFIVGVPASLYFWIRPGHRIYRVSKQVFLAQAPLEVVLFGLLVQESEYPEGYLVNHSVVLFAAHDELVLRDIVIDQVLRVIHHAVYRVLFVLHAADEIDTLVLVRLRHHHLVSQARRAVEVVHGNAVAVQMKNCFFGTHLLFYIRGESPEKATFIALVPLDWPNAPDWDRCQQIPIVAPLDQWDHLETLADAEHWERYIVEVFDLLWEIDYSFACFVVRVLISLSIDEFNHTAGEMHTVDTPEDVDERLFINIEGYRHCPISSPLIKVIVAIKHVWDFLLTLTLNLNFSRQSDNSYDWFILLRVLAVGGITCLRKVLWLCLSLTTRYILLFELVNHPSRWIQIPFIYSDVIKLHDLSDIHLLQSILHLRGRLMCHRILV